MKPEFTDRNRFFASVGLIMIALAVVLPWLVLKEPLEIHTTAEEINTLTRLGAINVSIRQGMALMLLAVACLGSPFLVGGGIMLLGIGLFGWSQKEGAENKRDKAEISRKLTEISRDERKEQAKVQTRLHEILEEKFKQCIPNAAEVLKHDWLIGNYQYEFALQFGATDQPDVLIRVNYAGSNKFLELASLYYKVAVRGLTSYRQTIKGNSRLVGLLVAPDSERISPNNIIATAMRKYHPQDVTFHHLTETQLVKKDCNEFLNLFFPDERYPWNKTE